MVNKKLNVYDLRVIARKNGLENPDLFAKCFNKRFPLVTDEYYIGQWAERFKRGNPTSFMDKECFKDYIIVLAHQRGLNKEKLTKLL